MKRLPLILLIAGFVLDFAFTGHNYLAYTLYGIAAVLLLFRFIGKAIKAVICIMLVLGLCYFGFVEASIIDCADEPAPENAQYIIVLGAAVHGDEPSLAMTERTDAAFDYLTEHEDTVAIVSGGMGDGENLSEAQAMFNYLTEKGIAGNRIIMEDKSTSTKENLANSFEIIRSRGDDPNDSTAVVTSEYHIYRAKMIAEDLCVSIDAIPAKTGYITVRINYFIREAFGVTYQELLG